MSLQDQFFILNSYHKNKPIVWFLSKLEDQADCIQNQKLNNQRIYSKFNNKVIIKKWKVDKKIKTLILLYKINPKYHMINQKIKENQSIIPQIEEIIQDQNAVHNQIKLM